MTTTSMLKGIASDLAGAAIRVLLIFVLLTAMVDSATRLYYTYMPVETWIRLRSVSVADINGEPVVFIDRTTRGDTVSVFHRTLFVLYPQISRACTASVVAVMDRPDQDIIALPLSRVLSDNCPEFLKNGKVEGMLQVSYILDFPFGVKRTAVAYSNRFGLSYSEGKYHIHSPSAAR